MTDVGILFIVWWHAASVVGLRELDRRGVGWMIRAYKFLLRPTVRQAQAQALAEMLRDHCSLCYAALQERRDAWTRRSPRSSAGSSPVTRPAIRAFAG